MATRRTRIGFFCGALAIAALVNGCFIGTEDTGRSCVKDSECPAVGGYLCVSTAQWPQRACAKDEKACRCEVKFPPVRVGADAGPTVDAGPPPDYCDDIRPTIQAKCLFTCHFQTGYPGSPMDFRLDYYVAPDAGVDGGLLPGVQARAARMAVRIEDNSMPPDQQTYPGYTAAERKLFLRWVNAGAPFGTGTCEGPRDGGVSFIRDVQPTFTARCAPGCHTGTAPEGGLNLTSGMAYSALVNVNTSNGCNLAGDKRVLAFDPKHSMLWQKLTPDGGYCNSPMPNGMAPLRVTAPTEFQKIESWIAQGAKQN